MQLLEPGVTEIVISTATVNLISEQAQPILGDLATNAPVYSVTVRQYEFEILTSCPVAWITSFRAETAKELSRLGDGQVGSAMVKSSAGGKFAPDSEFFKEAQKRHCAGCNSSCSCITETQKEKPLLPAALVLDYLEELLFKNRMVLTLDKDKLLVLPVSKPVGPDLYKKLSDIFGQENILLGVVANDCIEGARKALEYRNSKILQDRNIDCLFDLSRKSNNGDKSKNCQV